MFRLFLLVYLALTACTLNKNVPLTAMEQQQAFDLFDRHLLAIGGAEQLNRKKAYSITGTIKELGATQTHEYQLHQRAPDLYYIRINIRKYGIFERGYDGNTFWEQGPRESTILSPEEMAPLLPVIDFYADVNYRQWYPSITSRKEVEFAGQRCELLEVLNHQGNKEQIFFSKETGLKVGVVRFLDTEKETLIRYGHYIAHEGIKVPSSKEEKRGDLHRIWMIDSLRWESSDVDFSPPPSLLDKR